MSRELFEIRDADAAGRIGRLTVPRAGKTVETPALLPVVNPHLSGIAPALLEAEFGAEIIITNAYGLHGSDDLRDVVLNRGLHEMLEFSGAIMTDSGSFQLAEYGSIDVSSREILEFQYAIGSDIATPVDIPTPPDADRSAAERDLVLTQNRLEDAMSFEKGEMLISAPIQGSTFDDLRERAARDAYATTLDVFPIGAVVPLLNSYRFDEVVDVIAASKRGLGVDAPVHLFGAGHPMMFALAVAMGCDLFDSAAYALYARDDRYLTVGGTESVDDLAYLPCSCPICVELTPTELRSLDAKKRERRLEAHNLHVTFEEIRRIKQAITAGELLELVEMRARAHPAMLDGYRALAHHGASLERSEPASKPRPFFYVSEDSALRPEVRRHHHRLGRVPVRTHLVLVDAAVVDLDRDDRSWLDTTSLDVVVDTIDIDADAYDDLWFVVPPFGPVPPALLETYPLTAEIPARMDDASHMSASRGITTLVEANPEMTTTLIHGGWSNAALSTLPDSVAIECAHPN